MPSHSFHHLPVAGHKLVHFPFNYYVYEESFLDITVPMRERLAAIMEAGTKRPDDCFTVPVSAKKAASHQG